MSWQRGRKRERAGRAKSLQPQRTHGSSLHPRLLECNLKTSVTWTAAKLIKNSLTPAPKSFPPHEPPGATTERQEQ